MRKLLIVLAAVLLATTTGAATVTSPLTMSVPSVVTLQSAATTGNGDEVSTRFGLNLMTVLIIPSAGIASGAVQVETADVCGYAGTWAPLGSAQTLVASTEIIVQITAPVGCLRTRVSTTVVGGTVTTKFAGIAQAR